MPLNKPMISPGTIALFIIIYCFKGIAAVVGGSNDVSGKNGYINIRVYLKQNTIFLKVKILPLCFYSYPFL